MQLGNFQHGANVLFVSLTLFLHSSPVVAAPVDRTVHVSAEVMDLTQARVVTSLLNQPVNRIIVSCLVGGETMFPSKSSLFRQMPHYQGKGDALQSMIAQAHQRGIKVYGFVDCLHWSKPETPSPQDILESHPELAERASDGGCGVPADGKYASPFHPQVRQALRELTQELAERYPQLDGLLIQARFPAGSLLGYSETARAAYIRARQIDPIDVGVGSGVEDQKIASEWMHWRFDQMSALVKEISGAFRAKIPGAKVAATGYANWYRFNVGQRNVTLEDWLNWALSGDVDEMVLDCRWAFPQNRESFSFCRLLVEKTGKPIKLNALLPLREGKEILKPAAWLDALAAQGKVSGLVVQIKGEDDLSRATQVWNHRLLKAQANLGGNAGDCDLPSRQWRYHCCDSSTHNDCDGDDPGGLRDDPKLSLKASVPTREPTVKDILEAVSAETGLIMTVERSLEKIKPRSRFAEFKDVTAVSLMLWLAQSINGQWEKTERGYRLIEKPCTERVVADELLKQKLYEAAIRAYASAIERGANLLQSHLGMATAYQKMGKHEKAIPAFQLALSFDPDRIAAWRELGDSYRSLKKWDDAVSAYQQALRRKPDDMATMAVLGDAFTGKKDYRRAVHLLEDVVNKAKDSVWAHYFLGKALSESGERSRAIAEFETALRLDPKHEPTKRLLASLTEGTPNLGDDSPELQKDPNLGKRVSLALQGWTVQDVNDRLGKETGLTLTAQKGLQTRRVSGVTIEDIQVSSVMYWLAAGVYGRWLKKEGGYHLMERPSPERVKGDELLKEKRYDAALQAYDRTIERRIDLFGAYLGAGLAYKATKQYGQATQRLTMAVQYDPDHVGAWRELGNSYRLLKNWDDAIRAYQEALKRKPDDMATFIVLGDALVGKKDYARAIPILERAADRLADNPWAHFYLGNAYYSAGNRSKAIDEFEKALKIDPKHEPARKKLEQAKRQ